MDTLSRATVIIAMTACFKVFVSYLGSSDEFAKDLIKIDFSVLFY